MGTWTHAICEGCWIIKCMYKEPVKLINRVAETCCFCGDSTVSGIYIREDPAKVKYCKCISGVK
uniref:Uncharacterized protein n=1 Tax=viral metagenome TaxID=1070528 RepID=A0A6H1ZC26_9ZZZZ